MLVSAGFPEMAASWEKVKCNILPESSWKVISSLCLAKAAFHFLFMEAQCPER